jgi:hypothetical protein
MVHGGVKFAYIAFQDILVSPDKFHGPAAPHMDAFSHPASIRIINKKLFPNRGEDIHKGMLDDTVWIEGKNIDNPLLGLKYQFLVVSRCGEGFIYKRFSYE